MTRSQFVVVSFFIILAPVAAYADVTGLAFTTDPLTVGVGVISDQLTVQARDASGQSIALPQTGCLSLQSSSGNGQFSSSATNWSPVSVLTMNKSSANRSFYYKDTSAGSFTLTVKLALRPDTVSQSCSSWPTAEWSIVGSASQSITVGSASSGSSDGSSSSDTSTTTSDTSSSQITVNSAPTSSYVAPPTPTVFADAGPDRTVIVGADTEFDGRAYNRQKETVDHVRFLWNFGDGSTAEGAAVLHHYEYPGRYALILTIAENRYAVIDEVVVTAEPAQLGFTINSDGSVAIENRAGRDLDLSGWLVRSFGQFFTLPEHSVILSNSTMRIAQKTLKFWSGPQTELDYPNGVIALHANETSSAQTSAPMPPPATLSPVRVTAPAPSRPVSAVAPPETPLEVQGNVETSDSGVSSTSQVAAAAEASGGSYWWLGALALAGIAAGGVFAVRRVKAGEWDITEES